MTHWKKSDFLLLVISILLSIVLTTGNNFASNIGEKIDIINNTVTDFMMKTESRIKRLETLQEVQSREPKTTPYSQHQEPNRPDKQPVRYGLERLTQTGQVKRYQHSWYEKTRSG